MSDENVVEMEPKPPAPPPGPPPLVKEIRFWTCGQVKCPCPGDSKCNCVGSGGPDGDGHGGICKNCRTLLQLAVWHPSLPDIAGAFASYLSMYPGDAEGKGRWGNLNDVLDAGNLDDQTIAFSAARCYEENDGHGERLARILYALGPTQRKKLSRMRLR